MVQADDSTHVERRCMETTEKVKLSKAPNIKGKEAVVIPPVEKCSKTDHTADEAPHKMSRACVSQCTHSCQLGA